ncbi:glycosyltransferase family 4 protein [Microbacterium sp. HMH0099]|uniref:glycosyltransferase family 4 protein n=1 Tax=Microbacterium sp. HMH0099 TaxID=3414026 RepID=UPI003BF6BDA7
MHIVSVTRSVPHPGITHAGGEYYLRHVTALRSLGHRVTIVAPRTADNERAAALAPDGVLLYGDGDLSALTRAERLLLRIVPAVVTVRERRAILGDPAVRGQVALADAVEYQWTQAATLARCLSRRGFRTARRIVVLHDVMTQQTRRQLADTAASLGLRAQRLLKHLAVRAVERRAVAGADAIVVFSEKDAAQARALQRRGSDVVTVVRPPLAAGIEERPPRAGAASTFRVLMVGWFRRSDNADAALWLAREVWPCVVARLPHARLVLAGGDPTEEMRGLAARDETVTVTGYLDSLDEEYLAADAVAIPMRQGAGVKFKTVVAILQGCPVVSTAVGLEGITDDPALVWRQAETPAAFARGLIDAALSPDDATAVADRARDWARREFSDEAFRDALTRLFAEEVHPPAPGCPVAEPSTEAV